MAKYPRIGGPCGSARHQHRTTNTNNAAKNAMASD